MFDAHFIFSGSVNVNCKRLLTFLYNSCLTRSCSYLLRTLRPVSGRLSRISRRPPLHVFCSDCRPIMSYAKTLRRETFSAANQAIIFPYIDGVPVLTYAQKLIKIIGNNISHCGKISNNRVRMYLKTRELAEHQFSDGELEIDQKIIKQDDSVKKEMIRK